ncbi:MAG: peptide/nickel transport system permease protein [Solirubrobacteraceae bacterium]|jgi:peptide/nickel transport system permease protein|nr:peptide/nickel transport system permease protein [Solirubrobacteraceae bacterium]
MGRYIIRRLLWVVVLLLVVSAVTFIIFYALPSGDPAAARAGKSPSPEQLAQVRHTLGLDKPIYTQYWLYMKGIVLHFDLGHSYQTSQDVRDELFQRLPATASLTIGAVIVWMLFGLPIGVISAIKSRTFIDRLSMGGALLAISAPVYWLALVALYLFSNDIGLIHIFDGAGSYVPLTDNPAKWFSSMLLPWLVLAASFAAFYARLLRSNLVETMSQDFIRTARAKGLSERTVIGRHAIRAAITPIVTILGLDIGVLLGGSILTETVFNIPGIGRYSYDAIINADLPVIQGTVLLGAFFIVIANVVVDIVYAYLDPRVRYT